MAYDAYEVINSEFLADIGAKTTLLRHKKTGARVALIENEDEEKVFSIAFRTPPENSTGVAHIIEHSVLCGSQKYPLKDPFVELARTSLNTFLNAMTYPDKTVYPIASCNDTDFRNLRSVYLDSVFFPNIYTNEKIFRQEGWHYHLENEEDDLTINGVVYNEMKGAFSNPESVLERNLFSALFPDTAYGVESGGDPDFIPLLSYEEFLDFHRKYYHPSNSYIYFYGKLDMEEQLSFLDREYLSRFDKAQIHSEIRVQEPFAQPKDLVMSYPILDEEPEDDNTYLCCAIVTDEAKDLLERTAFSVIDNAVFSAPGSPVKQALLDAEIGKDIVCGYDDGLLQHYIAVEVKNANPGDKDRFIRTLFDALNRVCEEGIDELSLQASLFADEFRFREASSSGFPKGLAIGVSMLDSWLYDDSMPFDTLKMLHIYEELRQKIGTGYFENLIKEKILANPHRLVLTCKPEKGLAAAKEAALAAKLAAYKASLSEEEIRTLVEETAALAAYQEEPDLPEVREMLPHLTVADIKKDFTDEIRNEEVQENGARYLFHEYDTNGIDYLSLMFDLKNVPDEYYPYLGILRAAIGEMDTAKHGYNTVFNLVNSRSGGIGSSLVTLPKADKSDFRAFTVRSKFFYPDTEFVFDMISEILFDCGFDDEKRLYEIIAKQKAGLQRQLSSAGHSTAASLAFSGLFPSAAFKSRTQGFAFYRFIEDLYSAFDEKKQQLIAVLKDLVSRLFTRENLIIDVIAAREGFDTVKKAAAGFLSRLPEKCEKEGSFVWEKSRTARAVKTSGQVQFNAIAGDYTAKGYSYSGAMRVLKVILDYDFLWNNLRVQGGAYGCMCSFSRKGETVLVSYRDPKLPETYAVYDKLPEYLENFAADDNAMTGYIIGAVAGLDSPLTAQGKGDFALSCYFGEKTQADFQKERNEVLHTTVADIRAFAALVRDTLDREHIAVVGSETAVEENREMFDEIEAFVRA